METKLLCAQLDTFAGMPDTDDPRDRASVAGGDWKAGQFAGRYDELSAYCATNYTNWRCTRAISRTRLRQTLLNELVTHKPMLVWIDCDYYTSSRTVMERLLPYLPTGCVIYFDEPEFNFSSRFTAKRG